MLPYFRQIVNCSEHQTEVCYNCYEFFLLLSYDPISDGVGRIFGKNQSLVRVFGKNIHMSASKLYSVKKLKTGS
jgi:hypothetical protein